MTQSAPPITQQPATAPTTQPGWLIAVIIWQAIVAIGAIALGIGMATGAVFDFRGVGLVVVVVLAALTAAAAIYAIPYLLAHKNRGRSAATLLEYTLLVLTAIAALQVMGLFRGIDAVAANFRDSWYWALIIIVGWVIYSQAERFKSAESTIKLVGRWTMVAGAAILAIALGIIPGTVEFVRRLIEPDALLLAAIAVVCGVAFWLLRRHDAAEVFDTTVDEAETIDGYLFVSPNVFGFLAFFGFPLVFSLFVSFTDWDGLTAITWVGAENYIKIFSIQFVSLDVGESASQALSAGYFQAFRFGDIVMGARDPAFWIGFRNILFFAFIAIPLATFPALFLAALLNSKIPGMKVFRALYFIPYVAGLLGVLLIWKQLYNASIGFINYGILRFFDLINLIPGLEPHRAPARVVVRPQVCDVVDHHLLRVVHDGVQRRPLCRRYAGHTGVALRGGRHRRGELVEEVPQHHGPPPAANDLLRCGDNHDPRPPGLHRAVHPHGSPASTVGTGQLHADAGRAALSGRVPTVQPGLCLSFGLGAVHLHLRRDPHLLLASTPG